MLLSQKLNLLSILKALEPERDTLVYLEILEEEESLERVVRNWAPRARVLKITTDLQQADDTWNGTLLDPPEGPEREISGIYNYERIGYDARLIQLQANGRVGLGANRCEKKWRLDGDTLCLIGEDPIGEIARLVRLSGDRWKGAWTKFEQMPVVMEKQSPGEDFSLKTLDLAEILKSIKFSLTLLRVVSLKHLGKYLKAAPAPSIVFGDLGDMETDERNFRRSLETFMPQHRVYLDMRKRVFAAERQDQGKLLKEHDGTFVLRQECLTPWERRDSERRQ
jgi:hypothetical protein